MKLNLLVLLADLFNLFEIHPANCVSYPGMDPVGKLCSHLNLQRVYNRTYSINYFTQILNRKEFHFIKIIKFSFSNK